MSNYAGTNKLGYNGGRFYSFLNRPVLIDCNFVVDSANGNGLGIRQLKGSGVQAVYMDSSASAPVGSPALGTSRTYAILGASAVTNTGSSVLTGNLGLYPGTAVTGFPPGTFSGQENVANVAAQQAQASALAAYTAAQAMTPTIIATALDGQTLTPGVYKSAGGTFSLAASGAGTLILNGPGIYILQTASTLTTGAGGIPTITLTGGALASNVYWVVGSSATINSGSAGVFQGNIIAQVSITDTLGGTVNGSLIALTGAVTLSAASVINMQPLSTGLSPAPGYAWIQLANNYNRYCGGFSGFVSPLNGVNLAINGSALTIGNPYVIVLPGHASAGTVSLSPVADVAGSLASTYFSIPDAYGNVFTIWFSVSGVGSAPKGVAGVLVQQSINANDSAATIGADLVVTINNLLAAQPGNTHGPVGVMSFTASGTSTVTIVSTQTNPYGPLPSGIADGAIPTGFSFAIINNVTNGAAWRGVGLPRGVVANVGASFIASATGFSSMGSSTGLVQSPLVSGISSMEVVGDPNMSLSPIPQGTSPNVGGWILVQMLANGVPTAPVDGSVVGMSFYVEAGSILIAGE